ncbi:hypothetical protein DL96DRAFT_1574432 [Flagelloscypha sp. PMI_526]|nr:hypothetical protein DL96DRAFT_1574432 [Flagelloscypha sp. PMI_526]
MSSSNWFGLGNEMKPEKKEKQKFFNFGLKSKKPATSPAAYSTPYSTRPPSKSVSSRDESIGPRTPSDTNNRASVLTHNSLLTLSDADPFARTISVHQSSPQTELNRLSKYSHISTPESLSKQQEFPVARFSYGSGSSHGASNDLAAPQPVPKAAEPVFKSPRTSSTKLRRKPSNFSSESSLDDAWESLAQAVNGSHASAAKGNGVEDIPKRDRQQMRARGLTESSAGRPGYVAGEMFIRPAQTNQPVPRSAPVSPKVIVRQASQPRLATQPTIPLPIPPPLDRPFDDPDSEIFTGHSHSPSSSNFSLGSSTLFYNRRIDLQDWSPRFKNEQTDDRIEFASFRTGDSDQDDDFPSTMYRTPTHSPARTLKKALSHQSLRKPPAPLTPNPSSASSTPPLTPSSEKSIKKQRSFHHPKIPLPPLPSALRTQSSSAGHAFAQSPDLQSDLKDSKRSSALSSSSRKRLFSGSGLRRPSTASSVLAHSTEDDARSILSMQSDVDHHRTAAPSIKSVLRDDVGSPDRPATSSGISSAADYTPQRILSPADMYIIEASMSSESSPTQSPTEQRLGPRPRGLSSSSSRTTLTEGGNISYSTSLAPSNASVRSHRSAGAVGRVPSNASLNPTRHVSRPSQSLEDLVDRHDRIPSPPPQLISLPPPPRPRRSTTSSFSSTRSTSGMSTVSTASSGQTTVDRYMPLSPPPPSARTNRGPPSSMEKALHRRSIMRKPSFLEIDDTDVDDDESDAEVLTSKMKSAVQPISSSFLDLARESFDTVR